MREAAPDGTAPRISAPDRNRTCDLWYRKPTLYPLSYGGVPIEVITSPACRRPAQGLGDPMSCGASATTPVLSLICSSASATRVARYPCPFVDGWSRPMPVSMTSA
jgi:hypothetical protein